MGIASLMLLFTTGYATWHGMRDFIVGVSAASNDTGGLCRSLTMCCSPGARALIVAFPRCVTWLPAIADATRRSIHRDCAHIHATAKKVTAAFGSFSPSCTTRPQFRFWG